ncbi:hypothetical protein ELB75_09310 [Eikenella corrodens]|uniref:Uncharacterized protein n=1 Tax=Eikenella corrodens TaxID=539 RepID=A0A3S9SL20_EIKCO|nr:hypothetical protein ELB75_09310 [Eikenella corrodens]
MLNSTAANYAIFPSLTIYSGLTKIRTRRRAADSTHVTATGSAALEQQRMPTLTLYSQSFKHIKHNKGYLKSFR